MRSMVLEAPTINGSSEVTERQRWSTEVIEMTSSGRLAVFAALCTVACGAQPMIGPEPNEPSIEPQATGATEHMAAAQREEVRLARHQELYDPNARRSIRRCNPMSGDDPREAPECWVETINPTAIHEAEVRVHGDRAVYHRKAARDLREAEAQTCGSTAESARGTDPFGRSHVLGVSPLEEPAGARVTKNPLVGATVFLQPMTGVTAADLQRAMDCYSAHQAVVGYGPITTQTDRSPLKEPGSRATVRQLRHGYAVDVRADDPFAAQAIWLRAQRLAVVD
jgi:hypothetical protein